MATHDHEHLADTTTTTGLPVAPALSPSLARTSTGRSGLLADGRVVWISTVAIAVAVVSGFVAQILQRLIGLITNLAFYGRIATDFVSPAGNTLGWWVIPIPVIGGVIVGLMARYGSRGIRGHGIPEAMEQVLVNESRIPPRLTILKPVSAAIAIGTGGPFGAEGPIIATGGALGSFVGQLLSTTADERKTLLAAGAAAGMAATFGSPISAVLLAVELLLFELRPRSLVPVALAAATAATTRLALVGAEPVFTMPAAAPAGPLALVFYTLLGGFIGIVAVAVTRAVYAVEDAFEHLPFHWMWWPAVAGIVVGVVGIVHPHTLGVGYDNISHELSGDLGTQALLALCVLKFLSWSIALGSGTSGGTLAPLFTIGGALGAAVGGLAVAAAPALGVDPRIAGLVGMAGIFAGASRALLASIVFAFETTLRPEGLLPLLAGCTASYLISALVMKSTIMTEKIARRGIAVPSEYEADLLAQRRVRDAMSTAVISLDTARTVGDVRGWIASGAAGSSHQGFPVLDENGDLVGVVTRRDLLEPQAAETSTIGTLVTRTPTVVYEDDTLREATDAMVTAGVGRVAVVRREAPRRVIAMLSRSDVLGAHRRRIEGASRFEQSLRFRRSA